MRGRLWIALALALLMAGCNASGRPDGGAATTPVASGGGTALDAQGRYVVVPGDTVYGIANRFKVPIRSLIDVNGLKAPYVLAPGQVLTMPAQRVHIVASGDTVSEIAQRYSVDQSALVRANGLQPPYTIQVGQKLILPAAIETSAALPAGIPAPTGGAVTSQPLPAPSGGGTAPALPSASPGSTPLGGAPQPLPGTTSTTPSPTTPSTTTGSAGTGATAGTGQPAAGSVASIPQPAPRASGFFAWPVNGKIISSFGKKDDGLRNDGINIAAPRGTPVWAAENGVVVYAGSELRGFGNMLLIRHADGWVSAYAHNDSLLVKKGDEVERGQTIARVGSTGNVSQPQLHFELRKGTEAVDPKQFLAPQGA